MAELPSKPSDVGPGRYRRAFWPNMNGRQLWTFPEVGHPFHPIYTTPVLFVALRPSQAPESATVVDVISWLPGLPRLQKRTAIVSAGGLRRIRAHTVPTICPQLQITDVIWCEVFVQVARILAQWRGSRREARLLLRVGLIIRDRQGRHHRGRRLELLNGERTVNARRTVNTRGGIPSRHARHLAR